MFYIVKNICESVFFNPSEMHLIGKDVEILKRLKEKIQGRCTKKYGYILQLLTELYSIGQPFVEDGGAIRITIIFNAIVFKSNKDEIIDFMVNDVGDDYIKGTLGHALVIIPHSKIPPNWRYHKEDNSFWDIHTQQRIQKDAALRCKVFEEYVQMSKCCINIVDYQMKILGSLEGDLLGPL